MVRSKDDKKIQILAYTMLTLFLLAVLIPFITLFMSSFTEENTLILNGYSMFPQKFSLEAYKYIWSSKESIFRAYGITILVTLIGTTLNIAITILLAYPLSLKELPGRRILSFLVVFTMLFNGGLVPTYLIYTKMFHMRNSLFALLVPWLLFNPMNCIIVKTYLQGNIPSELYEAAKMDGASEFAVFKKIVLPLAKPILVAIGVFAGLAYWNNWTNGMYFISNTKLYSIQQLLNVMISNIEYLNEGTVSAIAANVPSTGSRMAIAAVAMIPMLVIFPFIQKYFQEGLSIGAVKG